MIRIGIGVKANVGYTDVKGALAAPGRSYNHTCESCQ
jgi:hypothetical protein